MDRRLSAVAFLSILWAAPALSQDPIDEAEARYEASLDEHSVLLEDRERTFSRYEQGLDRVDTARAAGDEAARATAHSNFQVAAFDLMDLELAVDQSSARVAGARAEYLLELEAGEEALLSRLGGDEVLDPQDEATLFDQWRRLRGRSLEVQVDAIPVAAVALRPVPELIVDPRDGPTESLEKAQFMEEQAGSYDSLIEDLDVQVQTLERQMQQQQSLQDLLRDVGRFGSDFLQGTSPELSAPNTPGAEAMPNGMGATDPNEALAALPLGERIELLRGARDLAFQYRDQALAMARVFRLRAEGMQP